MLAEIRRRLGAKPPKVPEDAAEVIRIMCDLHCTLDAEGDEADELTDTLEDRSEVAVPVLLGILDDASSPWREAAAEALIKIEDAGPKVLKHSLKSELPTRRRAAAYAIEWLDVSWQNYTMDSLPVIIEGLSSTDPVVRAHLMGALSEHDNDPALVRIAVGLEDENLDVRIAAAISLMWLHHYTWMLDDGPGIAPSEKALLALAKSKDVRARRVAFEALQYLAGPASEQTVLAALEDEDRIVRVTASLSLGRIGTPEAVSTLIAQLGSKHTWSRRAAAFAFENGPCAAGVESLIKALKDPDDDVVRLAIFALGEIGPAAGAAIPALEKLGGTNAREALENIRKK